jgi:hypothetical protein
MWDFLKYAFSFKDPALSCLAVAFVLFFTVLGLFYKRMTIKMIWFLLVLGGLVLCAVLYKLLVSDPYPGASPDPQPQPKPDRLTVIVHEASHHSNRYIENRGKIVLYSGDANKKTSYDIGKSGIVNIDNMISWISNDSTGIQVFISNLDTTKENAIILGNPYFVRANDTVKVSYSYISINDKKSETKPISGKVAQKPKDFVVYFNKKDERNRIVSKASNSVLNLKSVIEKRYFNPQEMNNILTTTLAKDNGNTTILDETKTLAEAGIKNEDDLWLIVQPKAYVVYKSTQAQPKADAVLTKITFTGYNFKKPVLKIGNDVTMLKMVNSTTYEALYLPTNKDVTISITDGAQTYIQSHTKLVPTGIKIDVKAMKRTVSQNKKFIDELRDDKFNYKIVQKKLNIIGF